jgi:hypothetical protein
MLILSPFALAFAAIVPCFADGATDTIAHRGRWIDRPVRDFRVRPMPRVRILRSGLIFAKDQLGAWNLGVLSVRVLILKYKLRSWVNNQQESTLIERNENVSINLKIPALNKLLGFHRDTAEGRSVDSHHGKCGALARIQTLCGANISSIEVNKMLDKTNILSYIGFRSICTRR